jgi:hypothetical protein
MYYNSCVLYTVENKPLKLAVDDLGLVHNVFWVQCSTYLKFVCDNFASEIEYEVGSLVYPAVFKLWEFLLLVYNRTPCNGVLDKLIVS